MSLVMLNERIHEQNKTKQNKKTGSDLSQTTTPWPVDSPF